ATVVASGRRIVLVLGRPSILPSRRQVRREKCRGQGKSPIARFRLATDNGSGSRPTIFVIDDDDSIRKSLSGSYGHWNLTWRHARPRMSSSSGGATKTPGASFSM